MHINPRHFIQALEEAGFEARSYSGRCMYGKSCVGVELDRGTSSFQLGVKLCHAALEVLSEDDARSIIEELSDVRTCEDSMGLGSITYWPSVEWVGDESEDEEDEDTDEPGQLQACEP
jgi:hypothetical protein